MEITYKNRAEVERLIGLQDDVLFYDHKYSRTLVNLETIANAFNDAAFLHYSLEYFPEDNTLRLKEIYEGEDGERFGFFYTAYATKTEDFKRLFENEKMAVEKGQ